MIRLLLAIILFISMPTLLAAQVRCLPARDDSVWVNKRAKLRRYVNRTIFIFENGFSDTVSVTVDQKLIVKRYMETTSAGAVIGVVVVPRPLTGQVVIRTTNFSCTEFCLKSGYLYAYINIDPFGKWLITYSNYERIYF